MLPILLRCYRMLMLLGIGWLLHWQAKLLRAASQAAVTLEQAKWVFPDAASLDLPDATAGAQFVKSAAGVSLGYVMTTSPQADHLVGYSGPTNLLIGLSPTHHVVGIRLLSSRDTPEHLKMIQDSPSFLKQWDKWSSESAALPEIDAVSGASLTSYAIAEAIQTRLRGASPSLRFPDAVTLDEAKLHFPAAASLVADRVKLTVLDVRKNPLGYLLRSSPSADNISGYAGPTECLVSLQLDGITAMKVTLRRSYDNESYVEQVAADPTYLKLFAGRTLETLAGLDYEKEQIEGVSGSTLTSYAIAESLKRRAQSVLQQRTVTPTKWSPTWSDGLIIAFVMGGIAFSFTSLRGNAKARVVWQLGLILLLGLYGGNLVSLAVMVGWAQHGFPWQGAAGLILLVAAALLIPWSTRRQTYCHHLCPHGAAQTLLGKLCKWKWRVPARLHRWLSLVPSLLLVTALGLVFTIHSVDLTTWEPFDAWSIRATAWVSGTIAVVGLILSCFIPQAYCHYGCPTGAILRYLRSSGSQDRFTKADAVAGLIVMVAAVMVL